jgi:hypothetical protein
MLSQDENRSMNCVAKRVAVEVQHSGNEQRTLLSGIVSVFPTATVNTSAAHKLKSGDFDGRKPSIFPATTKNRDSYSLHRMN